MNDPRNPPLRGGRFGNGLGKYSRLPFSPFGVEAFTPFAVAQDAPADLAVIGKKDSPAVGKVTHPSGAPDNHLLTVWSPGPVNSNNGLRRPAIDSGIYLIKSGQPVAEPGQMLLIKNDPNYNEQWPRALVPYKRVYGIDEPQRLAEAAARLGLKHVVITSVTRDDLPDGGADHFYRCILAVREKT
jgi:hypothetical protein